MLIAFAWLTTFNCLDSRDRATPVRRVNFPAIVPAWKTGGQSFVKIQIFKAVGTRQGTNTDRKVCAKEVFSSDVQPLRVRQDPS
jgi:hypothetical protein